MLLQNFAEQSPDPQVRYGFSNGILSNKIIYLLKFREIKHRINYCNSHELQVQLRFARKIKQPQNPSQRTKSLCTLSSYLSVLIFKPLWLAFYHSSTIPSLMEMVHPLRFEPKLMIHAPLGTQNDHLIEYSSKLFHPQKRTANIHQAGSPPSTNIRDYDSNRPRDDRNGNFKRFSRVCFI